MARKFDPMVARLQGEPTERHPHALSVGEQIDAIARGDYAAAVAGAVEDVHLDIFAPPEFRFIRKARSKSELLKALEANFESVTEQRPEIASVLSQGETLVLIGRERGIIAATGRPYDVQFVHRFTFREGRLAAVQIIAARANE